MTDPKPAMRTVDPRGEIMAQIAIANDETQRNFLILLLGILDQQTAQYEMLNHKLDAILSDEKAIRNTVLNGHADTHHDDHDYVKEMRAFKQQRKAIDTWALVQIETQAEAAKKSQTRWDRFVEGVISQGAAVLMSAIAAAFGLAYLVK
jgi:hypothetical protein